MIWLPLLLACQEPAPPAQPSAPAVSTRAASSTPMDEWLRFAEITPDAAPVPEAARPQVPVTLDDTVHMPADQRARLRQGLCGGDPNVLKAVEAAWITSTVDARFLVQPWADVVADCATPRNCLWAASQPEGRLRDLAHAVSARCPSSASSPWWLAPEAPTLAVIRHYQPPSAGSDRWRVPYHVRWSRALDARITQLGPQAGSDPDVSTGLRRLAAHPDPAANAAAKRLHARLADGTPPLPAADPASTDPMGCPRTRKDLPAAARAEPGSVAVLEKCWLSMLREYRMLATGEAQHLVDKGVHGSDLILADAQRLAEFPSSAKLADDLRGAGLIHTLTTVPDGTAWATPRQLLWHLGYTETLPAQVPYWPRGLDLALGRVVALPGSEIADTLFLEEEDGVIQAFADGQRWEVSALDTDGEVDIWGVTAFLNTIARDRGSATRFLPLDGGPEVIAGPGNGLLTAVQRRWLPLPTPTPHR